MFKRVLRLTLAAAMALSCLGQTTGVAPDPTVEPPNLYTHKLQLKAYVSSGGYTNGVTTVALSATKYLLKRIPKGAKPGKKLAIVFDIDETTLTNKDHIMANDFGYVPKSWDAWVAEARAPAIVPVQAVYDTAIRGKIDVFFITGRPETLKAPTEKNLREVGYDSWTRVFYKPTTDVTLSTRGFKVGVRRQLTMDGYVIIANIGDQDSDLTGGYAEKTFKLPNPFYITK